MTTEKRKKSIKIWLTNDEHEQLLKRASGKQLAPFLRELGLDTYVPKPRKEHPKIDPDFMRKFAGACNNLNQLTRLANAQKDTLEKVNLAFELAKISEQLERLKADVS